MSLTDTHEHQTRSPQEHPPLPAPSHQGSVVLDIGAGTGALVIHTNAAQDGLEIHVSPAGQNEDRTHAAVRPRHLPDRTMYAAVVTPLAAGSYTVWDQDGTRHGSTTISDGCVSDYRWI